MKCYRGLFLLLAWLVSGCPAQHLDALRTRQEGLEKRQGTLEASTETWNLRSESVATGLDRLTERLDEVVPPSAQWLRLQKGSAIKWYIDEQTQNLYLQYVDSNPERGTIFLAVNVAGRSSQQVMRPWEAFEVTWGEGEKARTYVVTLHRLLTREDGSRFAQFSLREGLPQGL